MNPSQLTLLVLPLLVGCATLRPSFGGADAKRPRVPVALEQLRAGGAPVKAPGIVTELRTWPGDDSVLVIASKGGQLEWCDLGSGERGSLLDREALGPVGSYVEEGLLSFAFAPDFPTSGLLVTSQTVPTGKATMSTLRAWRHLGERRFAGGEVVFELPQPDKGHHAGQVQFVPDGLLYASFGDGGSQRDPDELGQRVDTLQSTIIRLERTDGGWQAPADNPGRSLPGAPPELYAWGFRNPWRFSFAPDGRLVTGDVGQDASEEITVVVPGANHGWSLKEGRDCFAPGRKREVPGSCVETELVDPVYTYPRGEGGAVIGGYVYGGRSLPQLAGRYVFGDHLSGRLWAIDLPAPGGVAEATALGKRSVMMTTFGQGPDGELLVGALGGGIYKIVPAD